MKVVATAAVVAAISACGRTDTRKADATRVEQKLRAQTFNVSVAISGADDVLVIKGMGKLCLEDAFWNALLGDGQYNHGLFIGPFDPKRLSDDGFVRVECEDGATVTSKNLPWTPPTPAPTSNSDPWNMGQSTAAAAKVGMSLQDNLDEISKLFRQNGERVFLHAEDDGKRLLVAGPECSLDYVKDRWVKWAYENSTTFVRVECIGPDDKRYGVDLTR